MSIISDPKAIFGAAMGVAAFLWKKWPALLILDLTRKEKELELIGRAMEICQKNRLQSLKAADAMCDLCKKIKLPDEKIREVVEPLIEEAKDPLSFLPTPRQTALDALPNHLQNIKL